MTTLYFVVDKDGNPQDLCVKKPGEFDLDEQAAKAVMQYRFAPAIKDGNPVSMRIATEISFAMPDDAPLRGGVQGTRVAAPRPWLSQGRKNGG